MDKTKYLFIITRMGGGGAERVMSYIIQTLAVDPKNEVTLLLLKSDGNNYLSALPPNINIRYLNIYGRIRYNIYRIVKNILCIKPTICFSGLDKLNIMLAPFIPILKICGIKMIVRETNVLSCQCKKNRITKWLYKIFYNMYDCVIAQSDDMQHDLVSEWGIKSKKITKINNPVDTKNIDKKSELPSSYIKRDGKKNLIMIGRLTHQKGYDILFDKLVKFKSNIDFHIYIIGEGELQSKLEDQVNQLQIDDYITFCGYCENPYAELKNSDGLILASRYEGFPNVLLEANALGKPVFANRCQGGINEIIVENKNGITGNFNDQLSFNCSFNRFLNFHFNPTEIKKLTFQRYSLAKIMPQYCEIFQEVLEK